MGERSINLLDLGERNPMIKLTLIDRDVIKNERFGLISRFERY